ncbi:MAG: septum formation initiator family protein [Bdellovibrionales bacterium]|nr:septum formation initiator family protein [Bdellovibrionales bacterium]
MRGFINDKKDYFYLLCWGYLIALFIFSAIGDRGLLTSLSLWGEKKELQKDIHTLQLQTEEIRKEVVDFSSNDRKIYEYAREKMNMQHDHEIQYIFRKSPL